MRLRGWSLVLAVSLAVALAACGSNGESSGEPSSQGASGGESPTKVKVALLPIADVLPVYVGIEQGFFADEGIDLEAIPGAGGAAELPAILQEDIEFGFSNPVTVMLAAEQGLPVVIATNGNIVGDKEEQVSVLAVKDNSGIETATDLNGKTVGISTLKNISEVVVRNAINQAGGDDSQVNFVEIPMPEMQAALDAGRIDAASTAEPYTTMILEGGGRALLEPYRDLPPETSVAVYFTSRSYAEKHPDVVAGFVRAMNKSLTYAQQHQEEARSLLGSFTEISSEDRDRLTLWTWGPELSVDSLMPTGELAREYGLLEQAPDYEKLLLGSS